MSDKVVLDTSVLVALMDSRDKWHSVAIAIRDTLKAERSGLIYLDPVINETASVSWLGGYRSKGVLSPLAPCSTSSRVWRHPNALRGFPV